MLTSSVDVFWYDSAWSGAPQISGSAGALLSVLDACLITGFGTVTLDSLAVSNGVATATANAGHNFTDHTVALIAGAIPAALNGNKRLTRQSATVFTFDAAGVSNQVATGTITAKVAPAGWSKLFAGTNKAVYKRPVPSASAMLLRVDDSPALYPALVMYENMNDVDTGAGPAPVSGSYFTAKSGVANSTARPWRLFADGSLLYFYCDVLNSGGYTSGFAFGDAISYRSVDAYACLLIAHPTASSNYAYQAILGSNVGSLIARSHGQIGAAVPFQRYSHAISGNGLGLGGNTYPAAVDNGFHGWPVEVWESATVVRGIMPGLWNPLHANNPPGSAIISDIPQLPGRKLFVQPAVNGLYRCAMDITGPWR